MKVLSGLKPERVFAYFEDLCGIPHGSGHTDAISTYCEDFARTHQLSCRRDEYNNVIIRKPASPGYEDHPAVILQGHLDMVCEKDPDTAINMETDGLALFVDGDWIGAEHTTLGGDDGVAVAMGLAILEDDTLCHPALEVLFTTDEETGMDGAVGLDTSVLEGRLLINADSESEGVLTVGCAGGARAVIGIPVHREPVVAPCWQVTVDGLIGGHSGGEINKGRQNSNILMGQFLNSLSGKTGLLSLSGGAKDNVIPRKTDCVVTTEADITAAVDAFVASHRVATDPGLRVTVTPVKAQGQATDGESFRRICGFLTGVRNGVMAMSRDIAGLVQTSENLGVLELQENELRATFSVRSGINAEKDAALAVLEKTAKYFDGNFSSHGHYPAWEYRKDSPLRDTMVAVFRSQYGKDPTVEVIHAGLECGLFSDRIPGLDAVSFGPDMQDIHTSRERLCISSVARCYAYLCEVLRAL